ALSRLLNASTLDEQQAIYTGELHRSFWKGFVRWAMDRDMTLAMLGVPRAQRRQVETTYPGGIAKFIEDRIEPVCTRLPISDNSFWPFSFTSSYTAACCPEYLKPVPFAQLRDGLLDRVRIHTGTLLSFLKRSQESISRFVLLDHMDWLGTHHRAVLHEQWQA